MRGLTQLLTCDLADLKAWLVYLEADGASSAVEFLVACAHAEDQATFLAGHAKRSPSSDEWRDYWLSHVLDWRGVDDGVSIVPFDADLLRSLWRRDAKFRSWLIQESQQLDRFRGTA